MKKIVLVGTFAALCCESMIADSKPVKDTLQVLEEKCVVLQEQQVRLSDELVKLTKKHKGFEQKVQLVNDENSIQSRTIDSLCVVCEQLAETLSADRRKMGGMIDRANTELHANRDAIQSRTLWVGITALLFLVAMAIVVYRLTKRIKSGDISIDEVRKAQDALTIAQTKMQEESLRLDDKLLELFGKQITNDRTTTCNEIPDHSLVLKVADEIVRIELNMSHMDASVKGYKQLAKGIERIKNNFLAKGYEISDMLGKPYNEGMRIDADFVFDDTLEPGIRTITSITKPQVIYKGEMIQKAIVTVTQNI